MQIQALRYQVYDLISNLEESRATHESWCAVIRRLLAVVEPALGVGGKVIRDYGKILAACVQNSSARTLTLIRVCSLEQSWRAYGKISQCAT